MTFERGDLLLVPFPFIDLSAARRRPVLAVTMRWGRDDREFSSRAPDAAQHEGREPGCAFLCMGLFSHFLFWALPGAREGTCPGIPAPAPNKNSRVFRPGHPKLSP